ncbi:hypothetical protein [Christiangramia sp. SM2212]|uniref:Uncharacterized protein n=1 Tax=Christiangramia sediminicola TaxID=3073267 RepID=A0ABU1EPE0_9FLAO|nr:hypothetical protein [Christiangramia sp. SM2212]MDR5590253.1 hypothetical protein [Christiangramia sp. SM2212]
MAKIKNKWGSKRGSKTSGSVTMKNSNKKARYAKKVKEYNKSGKLKGVKYFAKASQKRATKAFKF